MAIDKIFNDANVDGIADNIFGAVNNSVSEVKQMQQRKAAENVQMVVEAFKKIETNITEKFDNVTDVIEKRVLTIKDGRDGSSGSDGRNGRDGKPGRDGVNGKQGPPGTPGKDGTDGVDGVSVTDASIDFDGSLVISLSSGQQINVGEVVPPELERQLVELRQGGGSAGSSGDVMGPTASTDNAIVRFDGTTGKLVQNSVVTIDDTGNTDFAQTPVLYSGDGTVKSGRLLGRYSYRTATPTTAYYYDLNNSNTITSADVLFASKLVTLIDSTITNANALTAFGTSYGAKNAGVSFVSGTASDILLASVGSAPLLNADINAVVVGYTSVGPRIAIQNYALNDDTANAISYVGAVHRFYPAGTEVAKISSTGLDVTGAATVSTTLGVTGVSTLTAGAVIQGLTVGRGGGAVASNTAVGASAMAATATGGNNVALGSSALTANTSGTNNVALGQGALSVNIIGANNTAVGRLALRDNTADNNTAVGYTALLVNSSGTNNVAIGREALQTNLTSSNSTAVGYQAGNLSTGIGNQFFGYSSGSAVTSGAKNVILGSYTGSAAPISATGSNNIVLSDGDGVVRQSIDSSGNVSITSGNLVMGTANKGIDFSANSSAAGMTSELLNDYEEGTWTPSVGGSPTAATYTTQSGFYTKVGRLVTVQCQLTINAINNGSTTVISGLPFPEGRSQIASISVGFFTGLATVVTFLSGYVDANSSTITFTSTTVATTGMNNAVAIFGSGARVNLTATYQTT